MSFQDALSIMYENQNIKMLDEMYREDPDLDSNIYEPDFYDACLDLEEA